MNCLISIVYRVCIAAYWILHSEFGLVSCNDIFSTSAMASQFRCKINRTSSKFTALKLDTVERSEDLSNEVDFFLKDVLITETSPFAQSVSE